jgi:hypothetical protein
MPEGKMNSQTKLICVFLLVTGLLPVTVQADTEDDWQYSATIFGWLPDITGDTAFPAGGGNDFSIPVESIVDNLQFTLQGSFDARKNRWGFFTDLIYMDLGANERVDGAGSVGHRDIPADVSVKVNFDMKSVLWTATGYYRLVNEPEKSFDLMAGLRFADVEQSLDWNFSGDIGDLPLPGREGGAKVDAQIWDAIVGMRGRFSFGTDNSWFVPYYFDIGAGDSDLTWLAAAGVGYRFGWGEVAAIWRYLDYDMSSGKPVGDMQFSGPAVGAIFRW